MSKAKVTIHRPIEGIDQPMSLIIEESTIFEIQALPDNQEINRFKFENTNWKGVQTKGGGKLINLDFEFQGNDLKFWNYNDDPKSEDLVCHVIHADGNYSAQEFHIPSHNSYNLNGFDMMVEIWNS